MTTSSPPVVIGVLSILAGMVVWEAVARAMSNPFVLPAFSDVIRKSVKLMLTGELFVHLEASYLRILVGFLLGSLAGAVGGFMIGTVDFIRQLFDPIVNFFRFIPPIAWLAPAVIWFGIGETSKISLIIYTTSFMVLINSLAGVSAVPRDRLRAAQCFGANSFQVLRWVLLPSTIPYILTGMRIALANSFAVIVVVEFLADRGLGYLILTSRDYGATDVIFVGVATLGAVGLTSSLVFDRIIHRVAWRYHLHK